jgi:hypothetical protein
VAGNGDHALDGSGVEPLPASVRSLTRGVWPAAPGTVVAKSVDEGITVGPCAGRSVLFGRNADDVHVSIGVDDRRVSRHQGTLTCDGARWWLRNTGRSPIRLSARLLFPGEEPFLLAEGYTPVFVPGSGGREHLLEVYVVGAGGDGPSGHQAGPTIAPATWPLSGDERLALVVLGQRYLLHEPNPQPLTWQQAAEQLAELQPAAAWTAERVEDMVVRVRTRLSSAGVTGLTDEDVAGPVGNVLNHNLIAELVHSATLVPLDLSRLDGD